MMNTTPISFDGMSYAKTLPTTPGVYRMWGVGDELLYIGKAKNLQRRVLSYFQRTHEDPRIRSLVKNILRMEVIVVPTEADALILESRLIKSDRPRYNIALRDDKGYPYLHLSTQDDIPRLKVQFGTKSKKGKYFGPFPSGEAVRQAMDVLQKHLKLRSCTDQVYANRSRPCLEYQIGRCTAPCVGLISKEDYQIRVQELEQILDGKSDKLLKQMISQMEHASQSLDFERAAILRDRIQSIRHIQTKISVEAAEGDRDVFAISSQDHVIYIAVVHVRQGKVVGSKTFKMDSMLPREEQLMEEENCQQIIEQFVVQYVQDPSRPLPPCIILAHQCDQTLLNEAMKKLNVDVDVSCGKAKKDHSFTAIAQSTADAAAASARSSVMLQEERNKDLVKLFSLPKIPERIECYDISHTQGIETVASCVVASPKGMNKSAYRKYNIEGITQGDDYAAMRQVLTRRFGKPVNLPDLLLIDGGLGQVGVAMDVLQHYNLDITVVGVSKGPERKAGEETLIVGNTGEVFEPGPHSQALHLIQVIRDEAHRFAIEGHRKKRDKRTIRSRLEDIPGVGPSKRQALLAMFGGLNDIKKASVNELMKVPGVGLELAQKIKDVLKND